MTARPDHAKPAPRSDEWLTPRWLLEPLGEFGLDPCAAPHMPWRTAAIMWTAADDGLSRPWPRVRAFLNPPYRKGLIGRFMAKMAEHNHGTALVNARTDTVWFRRFVWEVAAACLFIYQRIHFIPATRELGRDHNGHCSVLVAYGAYDVDRLAESGIEGAFVPLPGSCQLIAVYRGDGITWSALIAKVVERQGGCLDVQLAYALVKHHPKATANRNWQAKVRQVLQGPAFERIAPATYRLKGVA